MAQAPAGVGLAHCSAAMRWRGRAGSVAGMIDGVRDGAAGVRLAELVAALSLGG